MPPRVLMAIVSRPYTARLSSRPDKEASAVPLREPSTAGVRGAPGRGAGEQGRGAGDPGFPRSLGRRRVTALAANQDGACRDALLGRRAGRLPALG